MHRAPYEKYSAQKDHNVEDCRVNVDRHAFDEGFGEKSAGQCHKAGQQCKSDHLSGDNTGNSEHRDFHNPDDNRNGGICGYDAGAFNSGFNGDSGTMSKQ